MARNFTQTTDRVDYGSDAALNITGPLSITAWLYLNSASKFHMILCKSTATTANISYELRTASEVSPSRLVVIRASASVSSGQILSTAGISTGAWHHVAVTWQTTGNPDTVNFYIDGVLDSTVSAGNINFSTTTGAALVGNRFDFANAQDKRLAHVALYNKVLTLGEILQARARGRMDGANLILYAPLWGNLPDAQLVTGASQTLVISGANRLNGLAPYEIQNIAGGSGTGRGITSSVSDINTCGLWALKPAVVGTDIIHRGAGTIFSSASSSGATLALPAGTAATDVLMAYIMNAGGSTPAITPPAGWTLVGRASNNTSPGAAGALYWALGNVASTAFTWTAGTAVIAFIGGFIGVHNTTPSDASFTTGVNAFSGLLTFNSAVTSSNRAMLVGIGVQNTASGLPAFSDIWQHEPDLSGARRLSNLAGTDFIGGPPFVASYGTVSLPAGFWMASSGGANVIADFTVNFEAGAGLAADKPANLEWLVPLQIDKAVNLEWLLQLQSDKSVLLEYLQGLFADKIITLENGFASIKDATGNLEWLVPLADDGEIPFEFGNALQSDKIINFEILGVPVVQKDFIISMEWLAGIADDNTTALEFLIPLTDDNAIPFDFGMNLVDDAVIPLEFKISVTDDNAVALEILNQLLKDMVLPLDFGIGLVKDFIFNFEFTGGTGLLRDFVMALEWGAPVIRDVFPNLEFKAPLTADKTAAAEWLIPLTKDATVYFELTANTVDNALGFVLEWLAPLFADKSLNWENFPIGNPIGAEKINLYGGQVRSGGSIDKPVIRMAGEGQ